MMLRLIMFFFDISRELYMVAQEDNIKALL